MGTNSRKHTNQSRTNVKPKDLRDKYAMAALTGILANPDISTEAARLKVSIDYFRISIVKGALAIADIAMKERKK